MVFVKRPRPGLVLLTHGKHVHNREGSGKGVPRRDTSQNETGSERIVVHIRTPKGCSLEKVDIIQAADCTNKSDTEPIDQSIGSYFGLALVDILPPAGLYHPVLPVRIGSKLVPS